MKDTNHTYTCPMHPEVTGDRPGTCPKCGMELVSMEAQAEKHGRHGGLGRSSVLSSCFGRAG